MKITASCYSNAVVNCRVHSGSLVSNATSSKVLNTLCHHKVTNISDDVTVGVVGILGAVIAPVALGLTFVNAKKVDIGTSQQLHTDSSLSPPPSLSLFLSLPTSLPPCLSLPLSHSLLPPSLSHVR